jgi:hypothetical protein
MHEAPRVIVEARSLARGAKSLTGEAQSLAREAPNAIGGANLLTRMSEIEAELVPEPGLVSCLRPLPTQSGRSRR